MKPLKPSPHPVHHLLILVLAVFFTHSAMRAASVGTAWLQSNKLSNGRTSLNSGRNNDISWNHTSSIDPTTFEHNALLPGRLFVKRPGDYFVAGTLPMRSTGAGRAANSIEVYVNGRPRLGGLGQSSYIRNASNHNESSAHVHFLVTDLNEGDYLELRTRRVTTGDVPSEMEVASFYAEWIDESRNVFSALSNRNNSGTNLNLEEGTDDTGLQWTSDRSDDGYTHSTESSDITLKAASTYFVSVNVPLRGALPRGSVALEVMLDGERVPGGLAQQGYIRNSNGHQSSSLHWAGLITSSRSNQTLTFETFQRALEGTVTIQSGKRASVFIERLDSLDEIFQGSAFETDLGDSWNPSELSPILWDGSEPTFDRDVYSHSQGNASHEITLKQDGNYLLIYSDAIEGGAARSNPKITVRRNDTPIPGAETKSHYLRNADGHANSSATLVFFLQDMKSNDVLTLSVEREGGGGDPIIEEPAMITLIKKESFTPDPSLALPPRVVSVQSGVLGFTAKIEELGIPVNRDTIRATLSDRSVPLEISQDGNLIQVQFRFPEIPNPRSSHDAVLSFSDRQVIPQTYETPFRIVITTPFRKLPLEFARLTPERNQPGFVVRVSQISAEQSNQTNVHNNSIAGAERQLRGELRDPEFNEPYLNEAGPLNASEWEFEELTIETVINLEQDAADVGNFTFDTGHEDDFIPNIPGWADSTDGIVAEFVTFLELDAGFYTLGVNSDDGFQVSSDPMMEGVRPLVLGSFDGGRGSADTLFNVAVDTAGLYPFRLLWFEGGGGANVEFFSVHGDQRILINDRSHDLGIHAYQAATGRPEPPAPEIAEILSFQWNDGQLTIEFTGALAASPTPLGPFTLVPNATSPYTLSTTQNTQFFIAQ